ncbi:hypothetical protein I3842_06G009600 [Carya illinoinensis]|uniref:Cyclic nucleotide-gated ion channel 1-like n=1 Tax=Carya illinoinensis TaxID=32201 RepID=A0A922JGN0_CARIL|nr:hypothetical protein I3842_06G009600 [Carya illinoinensis]
MSPISANLLSLFEEVEKSSVLLRLFPHGVLHPVLYILVIVPIIFSDMRDYKSRHGRKVLNAVVLLQYVPRLFRIYRLWKIVKGSSPNKVKAESKKNMKRIRVMKAGFNLLLYLVASNVLGAFWYFISIQRETTCWQLACKNDIECSKTSPSFNCGDGFGNYTFLNDSCSVETPKTILFDFGIFQEARQSGILASKDFFQKTMYCFWWGLRNLRIRITSVNLEFFIPYNEPEDEHEGAAH